MTVALSRVVLTDDCLQSGRGSKTTGVSMTIRTFQ